MNLLRPVKERSPLALVALSALTTLLTLAFLLWRLVEYSALTEEILQIEPTVQRLRSEIVCLDGALTMSTRLAVITGEQHWQQSYRKLATRLDAALTQVIPLTRTLTGTTTAIVKTDIANQCRGEIEQRIFELLGQGQREAARQALFSADYDAQKGRFAEGVAQLDGQLSQVKRDARQSEHRYRWMAITGLLLAIPLLAVLWLYALHILCNWKARLIATQHQLTQAAAEQRQAEAIVSHYFDISPDLLCTAGLDGYFKRLNPAWGKVLGWSSAELCAKPFLSFVHPDDKAATLAVTRSLGRGEPIVDFENRYRRKDGGWRWLRWQVTSSPADGLIYALAQDVTERRLAAQDGA